MVEQIRADQRAADGPLIVMRSAGNNEPDDHGAEDLPPVKPFDPLTPREALDRLFNAAVSGGVGGVRACELLNIVRADLDARYSRDEHVAALEALEFSTRTLTIHECARWLEESEDLGLVAGRMSKAMRSAK